METNLRPTFLTILCVLTFVFSGYSIFNGISSYTSADTVVGMAKDAIEDAKDKIEEQAKNEKSSDLANKIINTISDGMSATNVKHNAIATIIASIFTLLGAILMWGLDKRGFWLYVFGILITIFAPMFIFGGVVGLAASGVQAFIGVVFCVLYGLNLKFMH